MKGPQITADRHLVAVLGAHSPIALTVIRELGERGIAVLAVSKYPHSIARASRYTQAFECVDGPMESWLPALRQKHAITHIAACSERHLLELSELKAGLTGVKLLTPNGEQLSLVLDKKRTLEIAEGLGISVPKSWQPLPGDDFEARIAGLTYPVVVKWSDPNAITDRLAAARLELEKAEHARGADELRPILERYRSLNIWPLVQSWCPGYGFGQMLNMHDGEATLRFQHRRLRECPPSGGVSSFCETLPLELHREQMALSEQLLKEIGWEGPAMCEYRYDPATGTYWLMEINGRFWGSIALAYHSGAHFAFESYRCAVDDEEIRASNYWRYRKARFVIPDMKHIAAVLRDRDIPIGKRIFAALEFCADFFDPRVRYYVWSWKDPMPFFADMRNIIRRDGKEDAGSADVPQLKKSA